MQYEEEIDPQEMTECIAYISKRFGKKFFKRGNYDGLKNKRTKGSSLQERSNSERKDSQTEDHNAMIVMDLTTSRVNVRIYSNTKRLARRLSKPPIEDITKEDKCNSILVSEYKTIGEKCEKVVMMN